MKKRLVALILCFFLTFQIGVIGYSQAVDAGEFIPSAIEFATESQAFQFLCGLMGVTPTTGFVASAGGVAVAGTLMLQKFEQWVIEQAYPVNVAMWLSKLKTGVIDKKDECFSAFKTWLSSLFQTESFIYEYNCDNFSTDWSTLISNNGYYLNVRKIFSHYKGVFYFVLIGDNVTLLYPTDIMQGNPFSFYCSSDPNGYDNSYGYWLQPADFSFKYLYYVQRYYSDAYKSCLPNLPSYSSVLEAINDISSTTSTDYVHNPSLDGFIDGSKGAIDDLDLDNVTTLPIGVQKDTVDIALDNVIDKLGSIESVLERIISGDLSIDKARQASDVVPVTKTKEGTISDVVTENEVIPVEEYVSDIEIIPPMPIPPSYDPNDYTVTGLQDVFPFCIPFDLIDFIGVIKADPEIPVFVINCSFLGKKFEDLTFTIDLKPFDPLAKICRYSELFLFCVGLIILTRNIIKG